MRTMTLAITALIAVWLVRPMPGFAHHGWASYDQANAVTLMGRIVEVSYTNPHGTLKLKSADEKVWSIVLAPVSRMTARGLLADMLPAGKVVSVTGYIHRQIPDELRVETITVDGKTIPLR